METELKELDREIRAIKRDARHAAGLENKVALQKKAKNLEKKRNEKRKKIVDTQDEIDEKKDNLISDIEGRLKEKIETSELFTIRWSVE